jgi:hypothetical protein
MIPAGARGRSSGAHAMAEEGGGSPGRDARRGRSANKEVVEVVVAADSRMTRALAWMMGLCFGRGGRRSRNQRAQERGAERTPPRFSAAATRRRRAAARGAPLLRALFLSLSLSLCLSLCLSLSLSSLSCFPGRQKDDENAQQQQQCTDPSSSLHALPVFERQVKTAPPPPRPAPPPTLRLAPATKAKPR